MDRIWYREGGTGGYGQVGRSRGEYSFIGSLPLSGFQVDEFKLQVTMIRSPLIAKIKRTSVLVSVEKRLAEDLETMKKMAEILEKETDMLANYRPLSERLKEEDKEGDVKMEGPTKENGTADDAWVHRGTKLLEAYLEKRLPLADTDESKLLRVCVPSIGEFRAYIHQSVFPNSMPNFTAYYVCGHVSAIPSIGVLLLLLLRGYRRPCGRAAAQMCEAYQDSL